MSGPAESAPVKSGSPPTDWLGWSGILLGILAIPSLGFLGVAGIPVAVFAIKRRPRSKPAWIGLAFSLLAIVFWICAFLFLAKQFRAIGPAAFWRNYPDGQIVHDQSDQGPWGGWRALHFQAQSADTFTQQSVENFAKRNGWTLKAQKNLTAQDLALLRNHRGEDVFPHMDASFSPSVDAAFRNYPRWISGGATVLQFDSGWIVAPGGTGDQTAFGYVIISDDGKEMSVYHLWGE